MPASLRPRSAQLSPFDPEIERLNDILADLPAGKPAPAVITRWVRCGIRGRRLPALKIRGSWYSTKEAVAGWFREVHESDVAATPAIDHDAVSDELKARGYA